MKERAINAYTLQNNGLKNSGTPVGTPVIPAQGVAFYSSHREANRTLRMDTGGLCQFCARKAERRVEMYSPLWQAGPIMYGECCLPLAEAVLRAAAPVKAAPTVLPKPADRRPQKMWLTAAVAAGIGFLAIGVERLLQVKLF